MATLQHYVRNIALDIVLSVVTCGLYNLYWQYQQIDTLNALLHDEKYSFVFWFGLTLVTCGLYHIYHEYRMSADLAVLAGQDPSSAGLTAVVLSVFGLSIVVDAIQQSQINSICGSTSL